MKSASQIAESLRASIAHYYSAPADGVRTRSELDKLLGELHWHYADATDRMKEFVEARWTVFESDLLGWQQVHVSEDFHAVSDDPIHFQPIIDEWKNVDVIMGLEATKRPERDGRDLDNGSLGPR